MDINRYIDTRGRAGDEASFAQVVLDGLATGGGLYVPQRIPHLNIDDIVDLAQLPYAEQAATVYKAFDTGIDEARIDRLMAQAYGDNFDTTDICPIVDMGSDMHMLELWHGPTSAFKDMALQCLPLFFGESARVLRDAGTEVGEFLILVATSGDTGKAALAGFAGTPGVRVGVLFPDHGVSDIQRKQMVTQVGDNVMVWGVQGNFDDCQTGVKQVFGDRAFAERLAAGRNMALSSANSMNWGRLMPQIVYYLSAYARMVAAGSVTQGDPIDVCVPTGNFGNILAAWYAREMGAPIERLLCASNENRVLTDFINTGTYDIRDRDFVLTPSPSMDILVSSNLERQLFELTGRDTDRIVGWMDDLNSTGRFAVDRDTFASLRAVFAADSVDNVTCLETIRRVHDATGHLVDPHTAVALEVAEHLRGENPVLVASTAHWAKFGQAVYRALHGIAYADALPDDVADLTGCKLNDLIASETGHTDIPAGLAALDAAPVRFRDTIGNTADDIRTAVLRFVDCA